MKLNHIQFNNLRRISLQQFLTNEQIVANKSVVDAKELHQLIKRKMFVATIFCMLVYFVMHRTRCLTNPVCSVQ